MSRRIREAKNDYGFYITRQRSFDGSDGKNLLGERIALGSAWQRHYNGFTNIL